MKVTYEGGYWLAEYKDKDGNMYLCEGETASSAMIDLYSMMLMRHQNDFFVALAKV